MTGPSRPLPDSLTRLLTAGLDGAIAPTPGDRVGGGLPAARPTADRRGALEDTVLRGVVIAVSGLFWITVLWLVIRHLLLPRIV